MVPSSSDRSRPHAPVSRPGDGVEGESIETSAWRWLSRLYPNDAPSDLAYDANEMVDAFVAGAGEASRMAKALWRISEERQYRAGYCQTYFAVEPALTAEEAQAVAREALSPIGRALTPPAEPVSRPAGEGEREAVARIIDPSAFLFAPDELPKGSRAQYDAFDKGDRIIALLSPAAPDAVRFYIDCEFDGHNGPLLSMALVREDGHSIHIRADIEPMDLWVRKNVLPIMDQHDASESATVYHDRVGDVIRQFIGRCERPVIIADSPVDIGRFCRALSTGSDGQWASTDYPLMQFEVHNVDCYPTELEGAVQHNAWWDAMALRHRLSALQPGGER